MDQTILKAQIKGKFENLTANYVPIFFLKAQVKK